MPVVSLEDSLIGQKFGEYAQNVLNERLYFFTDSDVHYNNWVKLLLGDIDDSFKKAISDSEFDIACRNLAEAYFERSQKFLTFTVNRVDIYDGKVVTLPEKEVKVREALQKLNYEIK